MPRNIIFTIAFFFAASLALSAQSTAPAPYIPLVSDLGFTYTYPSDWEVVDFKPALPAMRQSLEATAGSNEEKKGIECVQLSLLIRHGSPASVIEALVLPFDCLGVTYKDSDIASVGMGMAQGLGSSVNMNNPVYSSYKIGAHTIWIEKAQGSFKSRPDVNMQMEVLCGILKKGVVCWMTFASTDDALHTFENSTIKLEDDMPTRLVPVDAFKNASK